ncbi:Pentachlorophenol 4-monooxygenase [Pseudovibrio axinellae]|uniref:Pentachlorophenol 4-monooxygenase n=1 Tax=Pseudovibrio axinellae TaxID=989403 RepID=A0A165X332_9HYPH|nr:FAD-dependent monooxygenase [Pseudovibrio axinellae]KZL17298.1 Pentachlorophenol 4-monooxygenase [Pseudovibrio axinellae]SEQ19265.1 2-polyprenyl-6-methoxyphenol hydroxylase [Pseudovibrio axinellae]
MQRGRILIVGAGPGGLAAAIELKRRGFTPRIIDKNLRPHVQSRALAVNPRTLQILKPSGVADKLIQKGWKLKHVHFRGPSGELMEIALTDIKGPYKFMLSLPQYETETIMERHLTEQGVEVERGCELVELEQQADEVIAVVQNADGDQEVLHPGMVIGADGAHSVVRSKMGFTFAGSSYAYDWGLADVELEPTLSMDGPTMFDRSPYIFAVIPISANRARIIADQEDPLEDMPPILKVNKVNWKSTFRITHRLVNLYQKGRVFLVGDAAHVHSPFAGRGMNLGIEDAAWLAWQVSTGHTHQYMLDRRPVAAEVLKTVDHGTRFLASNNAAIRLFRQKFLPVLGRSRYFQGRLLSIVSADSTPFPPWLEGEE